MIRKTGAVLVKLEGLQLKLYIPVVELCSQWPQRSVCVCVCVCVCETWVGERETENENRRPIFAYIAIVAAGSEVSLEPRFTSQVKKGNPGRGGI